MINLSELLFDPDRDADELLVHAGGRDASRGEIQARALQVVEALATSGVGPGAAVAVMLGDGIDVTSVLFGVWRAGAVYVPLNPRLTPDEIAHVVEAVAPSAVVTTAEHTDHFSGLPVIVADTTGPTDQPLELHDAVGADGRDPHDTEDGAEAGAVAVAVAYGPDVALIQFTSGTTGKPKPVLLLHDGVLELIDGVLRKLRPGGTTSSEPDKARVVNLVPVSLSVWAGLYSIVFGMRTGAVIVTMERFDTHEFARLVKRFEIKSTVLPPAAMAMLSDDESIRDLSPLRYVRSITAPLSPLQARRFDARFGVGILNCYGQTEVGGEIIGWSAADLRAHPDKLGSIGRPHEGVELRLVGEDGLPLDNGGNGTDESGELWVRTPAMSGGYADGGDLSDRLSDDGFFRTGDLARVDPDGFVWIDGRVSYMINRGGLKVFPGDVEEVLRLSPDVVDAAVVGVPDDRLGEVPWAFIVVRGASPPVDELVALCRDHLAPYKVPVRFEMIDELPRNEVGKVLKHHLVALAATEPAQPAEPTQPSEPVADRPV